MESLFDYLAAVTWRNISQDVEHSLNKLLQTITTVIVIGGTFLYISPLIAIFAFIPIPVIIFGSFRFTKTIAK